MPAMQKRQHPQAQVAEQQDILFLLGIPEMRLRLMERADQRKLPGMRVAYFDRQGNQTARRGKGLSAKGLQIRNAV